MTTMIIMVGEVVSFNEKMGIRNKNSKNDKHKCLIVIAYFLILIFITM